MRVNVSCPVQAGWRGDKVMQAQGHTVDPPGVRRRITRWRSWWNKSELYPPSVDQWIAQRRKFFEQEREHAAQWQHRAADEAQAAVRAVQQHDAGLALRSVHRGAVLVFCKPLSLGSKAAEKTQGVNYALALPKA